VPICDELHDSYVYSVKSRARHTSKQLRFPSTTSQQEAQEAGLVQHLREAWGRKEAEALQRYQPSKLGLTQLEIHIFH